MSRSGYATLGNFEFLVSSCENQNVLAPSFIPHARRLPAPETRLDRVPTQQAPESVAVPEDKVSFNLSNGARLTRGCGGWRAGSDLDGSRGSDSPLHAGFRPTNAQNRCPSLTRTVLASHPWAQSQALLPRKTQLSNIYPELAIPAAKATAPVVGKAAHGPVRVWELIALCILLAVYLTTIALVGDQGTFLVNLAGPAAMGVILVAGVAPAVMRDIDLIWTPLFWFRIATVVYFSFGNVATYFLNPASQREIENFFAQYADFITKLNAVTTLGVIIVLATAFFVDRIQKNHRPAAAREGPRDHQIIEPKRLYNAGMLFLIIGGLVKVFYTMPSALGIGEGATLLGSLGSLALLADVGIYLIAVWAWNFRPSLLVLPITLTVIEVVVGFLEFSKTEVISAILVLALAWLSRGVTLVRVTVTSVTIIVVFGFIAPYVGQGRDEISRRYQNIGGASLSERIQIADTNFESPDNTRTNEQQSGLLRFSYVNGSSLALSLYDNGRPGGTMATLPAAFVPRFLWPDKPDMTAIGREFNYIANGNDQSGSSPGWFAESYWDYGWFGAAIFMVPVGIILQLWSSFSLWILRTGNWFYFPFCMLGMRTGSSVDGFVVPTLFATTILAIVAYGILRAGLEVYARTTGQLQPEDAIKT